MNVKVIVQVSDDDLVDTAEYQADMPNAISVGEAIRHVHPRLVMEHAEARSRARREQINASRAESSNQV